MNTCCELNDYRIRLQAEGMIIQNADLSQIKRLSLNPEDWGKAAHCACELALRWAGLWVDVETINTHYTVHALLMADDGPVLLRTQVPHEQPLPSHTPYYAVANRMERHASDLWGIKFSDHPQEQRWTRHQAWKENEAPLSPESSLAGHPPKLTPADKHYPFKRIQGGAVFEIPVGPVHAGIIEPGHFRFHVAGEPILSVEERLGYVHKGIEKLAVGRNPETLIRLAARVSGDSTVVHSWAACQALEEATGTIIPRRANLLRGWLCEQERVANHLGDIGGICNDVGFAFAQMQCQSLRERWLRRQAKYFGHRLLMDTVIPGGVSCDLEATALSSLIEDNSVWSQDCQSLFDLLNDIPSLEDRLLDTGYLSPASAQELGVTGYIGKASGQTHDRRVDQPYAPYDELNIPLALSDNGDVAARWQIRQGEILDSLKIMNQILHALQQEKMPTPIRVSLGTKQGGEGIGLIEGWRGETFCYLRLDKDNRVLRYFPRDPSWFAWPALERVLLNNIVPDFPVCNKSINGSYAGHDL